MEEVLLAQVTFYYVLYVLGLWKTVIIELGATGGAISAQIEIVVIRISTPHYAPTKYSIMVIPHHVPSDTQHSKCPGDAILPDHWFLPRASDPLPDCTQLKKDKKHQQYIKKGRKDQQQQQWFGIIKRINNISKKGLVSHNVILE